MVLVRVSRTLEQAEGMIWGSVIGNQADEQEWHSVKPILRLMEKNMGEVYTGSAYDTIYMLQSLE